MTIAIRCVLIDIFIQDNKLMATPWQNVNRYKMYKMFIFSDCRSAFTARYPSEGQTSGSLKYGTLITDIGGQFTASTGQYICEYPGIYYFEFHLFRSSTPSYGYAYCYIRKNGSNQILAYVQPASNCLNGFYESSNSVVLHLSRRDKVDIGDCLRIGIIHSYSSFSGFLIKAD